VTHPFHVGRDARYTGAATIPTVGREPVPAAALVLHHTKAIPLDPMFQQLDTRPQQRGVADVRLVPVMVADFYARKP
jgi:hypothetical protein